MDKTAKFITEKLSAAGFEDDEVDIICEFVILAKSIRLDQARTDEDKRRDLGVSARFVANILLSKLGINATDVFFNFKDIF